MTASSPRLSRAHRAASTRSSVWRIVAGTAMSAVLSTVAIAGPQGAASAAGGRAAVGTHAVQQAAPIGDLPGWRQIFSDNFSTNVPAGQFPAAVSSKWHAYPSPWKDTSGYGTYDPSIVSINNGVLTKYIHTAGSSPRVAALLPKVPGTSKSGQTYGRYAVRFRADKLAGYKMAWMLWPDSNNGAEGEIDFPEKNIDSPNVFAFMHHRNATSGSDQDWFKAAIDITAWHTTVIEWSPNLAVFYLDGVEIGRTTDRVPNVAMHWVLQTEVALSTGTKPSASVAGNVQIDWVAAWAYDPTAGVSADTAGPTVALSGINGGATVTATATVGAAASDPSGVTAVKWYVDGAQVAYDGAGTTWSATWDTRGFGNGVHRLYAKARDGAGNWGSSPAIDITIAN